jgi:hypothetical protein
MYIHVHKHEMHMVIAYELGVSRVRVHFWTCHRNMNMKATSLTTQPKEKPNERKPAAQGHRNHAIYGGPSKFLSKPTFSNQHPASKIHPASTQTDPEDRPLIANKRS